VRIDQVIVGATPGDAITSMAMELAADLERVAPSKIFAVHRSDFLAGVVENLSDYPWSGSSEDIIVYHASIGEPRLTRFLLSRPERVVLVYHNITPADYLLDVEPHTASHLSWGRHELDLLKDRVCLTVAVSEFNARELATLGYDDVKVVRAGLRPHRLLDEKPDERFAAELERRVDGPLILTVAQILPHKRIDLILEGYHVLRAYLDVDASLVIVGAERQPRYVSSLVSLSNRLTSDGVWFSGRISDAELAECYRAAAIFVTASEHEGLCIPPLEAMAFGVPVIARRCAALPETIGAAGVLLPRSGGPLLLAEAMAELLGNEKLRLDLQSAGRRRLAEFDSEAYRLDFLSLLGTLF
jgi:glycosyltransferase involved in cell wall biosynthesis